ncbi:Uncharacterised protein [Mycobacteroides abscessus subsp. abscessus]|nr:Uncharacterised protein [Mycobacteroides abscessus subsp. abscessus]
MKKIVPAAAPIPLTPNGAKSEKLPAWNAVNAMIANTERTASLSSTMTVLTSADSLVPRMSRIAHMMMSRTAGRLSQGCGAAGSAPSQGAALIACGRCHPKRLTKSLSRYWLQPTATAAADTPYSNSRQAATTIAASSPKVV